MVARLRLPRPDNLRILDVVGRNIDPTDVVADKLPKLRPYIQTGASALAVHCNVCLLGRA